MTSSPNAQPPFTYRARTSLVLAVVLVAVAVVGVVSVGVAGGIGRLPDALPLLAVAYAAWLLFWFPKVEVDAEAVTLVNPFRTVSVGWNALIHVDTKYALTLLTPHGRYSAWAAPAPGVVSSLRDARTSTKAEEREGGNWKSIRPGDQIGSDSGAVAHVIRTRWQAMADRGQINVDETQANRPVVRFHFVHVGLLLVLVVACFVVPAL